jgi:NTP pyrophosphatase (non-canonical NTP hydrolase)
MLADSIGIFEFSNGLSAAQEEMFQLMEEECAELIQAVSKVRRHGLSSVNRDGTAFNRDDLLEEASDVLACLALLTHNGLLDREKMNDMARIKLNRIKDPTTRRVHYITPEMVP